MAGLDEPGLFSARWDPALRTMRMHWEAQGDLARLQPALDRVLSDLLGRQAAGLLIDMTAVEYRGSGEVLRWLVEEWLPRLLKAGSLRAIVTVIPRAPAVQQRLQAYRTAVGDQLPFANVGSVAEAEAWLRARGL